MEKSGAHSSPRKERINNISPNGGSEKMSETSKNTLSKDNADQTRSSWMAAGGVVGSILASSCCILPLVFVSMGVGGAWMGNLTAMAPYQPLFTMITFGFLGYGYYLVYWKPKADCEENDACAKPINQRIVKFGLFAATALVLAATAAQYVPAGYLDFL